MRIAVTGAGGRIGQVVAALAREQGHEVVGVDRRPLDDVGSIEPLLHIDLADYPAVIDAFDGCDALIHLAAISGPGVHPDHEVHDNNVVGSYHALRAAAEVGIRRVCQASSVNAIGGRFSRVARYDYFPVDERHPTYAEDPYSLSKWICEGQADALARRYEGVAIASLRLHGVVESRAAAVTWPDRIGDGVARQLWGYTRADAAARAFLLGLTADLTGHERFNIVAPDTMVETPSHQLWERHYAEVPLRAELPGRASFFDCSKATRILGWHHDHEGGHHGTTAHDPGDQRRRPGESPGTP